MAGPGGSERGRVSIRVVPDTSSFVEDLRRFAARLERSLRIEIPVVLDTSGLTDELRRAVREAQESVGRIDLATDIDSAALIASVRRAVAEAQAAAGSIDVRVDVDRRGLGALTTAARTAGGGNSKGGLGGLAKGILALGAAAALSTPSTLSLAASLAQVAQSAALAPALLGAAAVGAATLAVGFRGVGAALQNSGDPQKYAESLKGLAPAAQSFVRATAGLKGSADALKASVQGALFAGLGKSIQQVAARNLPLLQSGLTGVATQLNGMLAAFARFAASAESVRDLGVFLTNVKAAFVGLKGAVTPILAALRDIGVVGSTFLPGLAKAATVAAKAFAAFIAGARGTGELADFIKTGLTALKQLGTVAIAAATAVGGIFKAAQAAGGGTLAGLAAGLTGISNVINSPVFQKGLTIFFAGLQAGFASLVSALPAVGSALAALAPGIALAARLLGGVLGQALRFVAQAVEQLAPIIAPLVTVLGGALRAAIQGIGPVLVALGQAMAAVLVPALNAIIPILPVLTSSFAQFGSILSTSLIALGPQLQQIGTVLGNTLATALVSLAPVLPIIAQAFVDLLTAMLPTVVSTTQLVQALLPLLPPLVELAVSVIPPLVSALVLLQQAYGQVAAIISAVLVPGINKITAPIANAISSFARMRAALTISQSSLATFGAAAGRIIRQAFDAIAATVKTKVAQVQSTVQSLPGKVRSGLGDLSGLLRSAGADLVRGFVQGIQGLAGQAADAARNMAEAAVAAAKAHLGIKSPSRVMALLGRYVTQGFVQGILGTVDQVKAAGLTLANKLQDAVAQYKPRRSALQKRIAADTAAVARAYDRYQDTLKRKGKGAADAQKAALETLNRARAKKRNDKADLSAFDKAFAAVAKDPKAAAKALKAYKDQSKQLASLAKQRTKVAEQLKAAQSALEQAIKTKTDFAAQVKANLVAFGDITQAGPGGTAKEIIAGLRERAKAVANYVKTLAALQKLGLNKDAYRQLLDAGVDAGGATAAALLAGGKDAVAQVNTLQAQIAKAGASLGETSSTTFYQAGIDAAQGLVDGLKQKSKQLADAAKTLADAIVAAIKKALKIHSPSKVMAQLGVFTTQGFANGMGSAQHLVDKRVANLVRPGRYDLSGYGAGAGAGGDGGVVFNGNVGWDPDEVARRIAVRKRDEAVRSNLRSLVGV